MKKSAITKASIAGEQKKSAFVCVSIIPIISDLPTSRCFFDEPAEAESEKVEEKVYRTNNSHSHSVALNVNLFHLGLY